MIHKITSSERGLLSNSYIVEGRERLVVIDPPMLLSDARSLAGQLTAIGKPLGSVIVTHAHPDHANGAIELPEAPIVSLSATARVLTETAEPKRAQWTPVFGEDYPQSIRLPNRLVEDGDAFAVDELQFRVKDFGAGECASMALWILEAPERAVFAGDFVYPGVHGWLAEGRTAKWIAQLDELGAVLRDADRLYPGHGDSAGVDALADQKSYLEYFRGVVARQSGGKASLEPDAVSAIVTEVSARYPAHRLPALIALGAAGVARELATPG
jgi:glyoxylase-like metal-dependent hydrolase (beta-lactamase superfamily II)